MGRVRPWARTLAGRPSSPPGTAPVAPGSDRRAVLRFQVASVTCSRREAAPAATHKRFLSFSRLFLSIDNNRLVEPAEASPPRTPRQEKITFNGTAGQARV